MIEIRFICDKCGYEHTEECISSSEIVEEIIPDGWEINQEELFCEDCNLEMEK